MAQIINQRITAQAQDDFVVFLIGMRINRLWKVRQWLPVAMAMPKMIQELSQEPESGLLGVESWFGNPTVMVQYWRSFEHLERYARDKSREHLSAWAAFSRAIGSSGDVGIWHETYRVRPGDYESVYNNMPLFGLAKATRAVPASGARQSAAGRLRAGAGSPSTSGQVPGT